MEANVKNCCYLLITTERFRNDGVTMTHTSYDAFESADDAKRARSRKREAYHLQEKIPFPEFQNAPIYKRNTRFYTQEEVNYDGVVGYLPAGLGCAPILYHVDVEMTIIKVDLHPKEEEE